MSCGCALLPLKTKVKGPAAPCPPDQVDIVDESLLLLPRQRPLPQLPTQVTRRPHPLLPHRVHRRGASRLPEVPRRRMRRSAPSPQLSCRRRSRCRGRRASHCRASSRCRRVGRRGTRGGTTSDRRGRRRSFASSNWHTQTTQPAHLHTRCPQPLRCTAEQMSHQHTHTITPQHTLTPRIVCSSTPSSCLVRVTDPSHCLRCVWATRVDVLLEEEVHEHHQHLTQLRYPPCLDGLRLIALRGRLTGGEEKSSTSELCCIAWASDSIDKIQ